jgi:hypothetical protein
MLDVVLVRKSGTSGRRERKTPLEGFRVLEMDIWRFGTGWREFLSPIILECVTDGMVESTAKGFSSIASC